MNEQWSKWEPISGLEGKYSLEQLSEGIHGFEIILINAQDTTKKIKLLWKNWVQSYAKTRRAQVIDTKAFLDQKYGSDFYNNWSFFIVEDSTYLKKLSEESWKLSDAYEVMHFALITQDSIINIIPTYEPEVTWIN